MRARSLPATPDPLPRRAALAAIGGIAASLLACRGGKTAQAPDATSAGSATACTLTPEQEEGPFYVPIHLLRRDITEGEPGVPLSLAVRVLDARTCRPIPGASVDVWHANAGGDYSDEAGQQTTGKTFLRGMQTTDARGEASFESVYPGWYPGRTVHVHVKVRPPVALAASDRAPTCHTGDLFFPQPTNDAIAAMEPYAAKNANARTRNDDDHVLLSQGGAQCVCTVSGSPSRGLVASIDLHVDPSTVPAPVGFGFGPPPPRPT